jgi:hypothetical protein
MPIMRDLTKIEKVLATIVAIIATIVALGTYTYKGYDHFVTKAYAAEEHTALKNSLSSADQEVLSALHTTQEKLTISSNRAEIWRAKREIKRLTRDRAKEGNSITEVMLIDEDIAEYRDLIDCIREGKRLCY